MLDYTPLWKTMERKGISQYRLIKLGVDKKTLDGLKKREQYHPAHIGEDLHNSGLHTQ